MKASKYLISVTKDTADFIKGFWDYHVDRGAIAGLITVMVFSLFFVHSKAPYVETWTTNMFPYGVLWAWLNPFVLVANELLYKLYLIIVTGASAFVQWRFFVRSGRIPKWLFYFWWCGMDGWLLNGVLQNITVMAVAPLAVVYPALTLFLVLQKLPIVWSFPNITANLHWQCAFNGTQTTADGPLWALTCPTAALRADPSAPYFWSYVFIMIWVILPLMVWAYRKWRVKK